MSLKALKSRLPSFSAYLLSIVFLAAGISKIINLKDFLILLKQYDFLSETIIPYLGILLVSLEITLGVCMLIPQLRGIAALGASGLLTVFLFLIVYVQAKELSISCGCFAFLQEREMGVGLAIQDGILLFLAALLFRNQILNKTSNQDDSVKEDMASLAN